MVLCIEPDHLDCYANKDAMKPLYCLFPSNGINPGGRHPDRKGIKKKAPYCSSGSIASAAF
jgi:hypothetical protein